MIKQSDFLEVVELLKTILENSYEAPVLSWRGEPSLDALDFVYLPVQSSLEAESSGPDKRSVELQSPSGSGESAGGEKHSGLASNFRCTLCSDRLFPLRKYYRSGTGKILVLHYSGEIKGKFPGRDTSEKHIFTTPEEDDLFQRMIRASGREMEEIHFQEYPACIFDPSGSDEEMWNFRCRNCLSFVESTIKNHQIELLILTGPAAIFLIGEEMALKHSRSGEPLPLEFAGRTVSTVVIRSPAALLAYEKKRSKVLLTDPEKKSDEYKNLVREEKQVKTSILNTLKKASADLN